MNAVIKKCKVCGRRFTLGVDGVRGDLCDEHAGVKRDKNSHAWFPDDDVHEFENGTSITRKQAGVD